MPDTLQAMSIMLPKDMYHWLRAEAFRQHTSMSRVISYAMLGYMEQVETERRVAWQSPER